MRADVVRDPAAQEAARSSAPHAIEFADQQIDRGVGVLVQNRRGAIGPGDLDAPLGGKPPQAATDVGFDFDPQSDDARIVTKKPAGFRLERFFHGGSQRQVDAADDEFRFVFGSFVSGHDDVFLGFARARRAAVPGRGEGEAWGGERASRAAAPKRASPL